MINEEDYPAIKAAVDTMLLERNLKWKQIAKELNLTVNQLQRWRNYSGYKDPRRNNLSEGELDAIVQGLTRNRPLRGEKTIEGRLLGAGIKVTRSELRSSMHRIDPEAVAMRY